MRLLDLNVRLKSHHLTNAHKRYFWTKNFPFVAKSKREMVYGRKFLVNKFKNTQGFFNLQIKIKKLKDKFADKSFIVFKLARKKDPYCVVQFPPTISTNYYKNQRKTNFTDKNQKINKLLNNSKFIIYNGQTIYRQAQNKT